MNTLMLPEDLWQNSELRIYHHQRVLHMLIHWFLSFYNPFRHPYEDFLFRSCQSSQHTGHIQTTWTPGLGWGVIHPWKFLCIQGILLRWWSLQTLFFMFASLYLNSLSLKIGNKVFESFFSVVIRFDDE